MELETTTALMVQQNVSALVGRALLLAIIVTGIMFRLLGLGWGIPRAMAPGATVYRTSFHFDEHTYISGVMNINPRTWDYDVRDYHWGTLQFYLVGGALKTARLLGYLSQSWKESSVAVDPEDFRRTYIAGRAVSALAGILTILVAFLFGRQLKDADAGLVAAAFLSVTPLHVLNSHFLTSDVTMVLLSVVSVYCFTIWLERGDLLSRVVGAFFLGLGVSAKYNAAFLVPLWVAGDFVYHRQNTRTAAPAWKACTLGYIAMVAGFTTGEPYALIHLRTFIDTIRRNYFLSNGVVREVTIPWPQLVREQAQAVWHFGMHWTLAVPACAGILFCLFRPTRTSLALAGSILLTSASLAFARWPMVRYTLPLVALAAIAAAFFLAECPVSPAWRPFIAGLLCAVPLMISWAQVKIMLGEHTANRASDWIYRHIPAGSRIGQIWPELPPLDQRQYDLHQLHGLFGKELLSPKDVDRDYLILDNLPILPFNSDFLALLTHQYFPVAEFRADARVGPWCLNEENAPHDWKYTHPVLTIYERKGTNFNRFGEHQVPSER